MLMISFATDVMQIQVTLVGMFFFIFKPSSRPVPFLFGTKQLPIIILYQVRSDPWFQIYRELEDEGKVQWIFLDDLGSN